MFNAHPHLFPPEPSLTPVAGQHLSPHWLIRPVQVKRGFTFDGPVVSTDQLKSSESPGSMAECPAPSRTLRMVWRSSFIGPHWCVVGTGSHHPPRDIHDMYSKWF